jgi:hypothetical protein
MNSFEIFYEKVVQNIEAWKPKPPKLEKEKSKQDTEPKTEYYYFVSDTEKQVGPVSLQKLRQDTSELDIQKVAV